MVRFRQLDLLTERLQRRSNSAAKPGTSLRSQTPEPPWLRRPMQGTPPSSLSALLDWLGLRLGLVLLGSLLVGVLLRLLGLLGGHLLHLAVLELLDGDVVGLVALVTGLSLAALDLVEGHTNNGLLDADGLAGSLLVQLVDSDLLVEASPGEGPGELNGLDFLVIHATGLGGNEEVGSSVSSDVSAAATGVDLVLSVGALLSFRNHF